MTVIEGEEYFCSAYSQCRLCQFRLQEGDQVVSVFDDGRVSDSFPWNSGDLVDDEATGGVLHLCIAAPCAAVQGQKVKCLHRECHAVLFLPLSPSFLEPLEYTYIPSALVEDRRRDRICWAATRALHRDFLRCMPLDLCFMIATYLCREFTAVAAQILAQDSHPSRVTVDPSSDLYATYVNIEGVSYLQSLCTSPSPGDGQARALIETHKGLSLQKVYIAYDHLGVRDIRLLPTALTRPATSSRNYSPLWWTELSCDTSSKIIVENDGLKVRRLLHDTGTSLIRKQSSPIVGWPAPGLSYRLVDLKTCNTLYQAPRDLRMNLVRCDKEAKSYSVAVDGLGVRGVWSHKSAAPKGFYAESSITLNIAMWMHFPMNPCEFLTEIRAIKFPRPGLIGLLFYTNQARSMMFGCFIRMPSVQLESHCLWKAELDEPCLFFDDWDPHLGNKRLEYFGLQERNPRDEANGASMRSSIAHWDPYPPSLKPSTSPPYTQSNEPWYYTSCRLGNATSVRYCIDSTSSYKPIIGMLFTYEDNSVACVGQYRTDWATENLLLEVNKGFRIGIARTDKNLPYVARVTRQNTLDSDAQSLQWLKVDRQSKLEWWFSNRRSRIVLCEEEQILLRENGP